MKLVQQEWVISLLEKGEPRNFYDLNHSGVSWPDDEYYKTVLLPLIQSDEIVEEIIPTIQDVSSPDDMNYRFRLYYLGKNEVIEM